jgi:ankyrin repeat protein
MDSNGRAQSGRTPLYAAALNGSVEICSMLLHAGADVKARDVRHLTALHAAAVRDSSEICKLLIEAGADVNATTVPLKHTPLYAAAKHSSVNACRVLIRAGITVDARDIQQCTALHAAAILPKPEFCRILLDAGADVNAKNTEISTPLHFCTGSFEGLMVCRLLIDAGAEVNSYDSRRVTPLGAAVAQGRVCHCDVLIKAGADVNAKDNRQRTPLHYATRHHSSKDKTRHHSSPQPEHDATLEYGEQICEKLLKAGADVNAIDSKLLTPLHGAALGGRLELCRLLLRFGANPRATSAVQRTPLHAAASLGHEKVCLFLVHAAADLAVDHNLDSANSAKSPAYYARKHGACSLAHHLDQSDGVHYFRCVGPARERRLVWNDISEGEEHAILEEMQAGWVAKVRTCCTHTLIGHTISRCGRAQGHTLSAPALLQILRFTFAEVEPQLLSYALTAQETSKRIEIARRALAFAGQSVLAQAKITETVSRASHIRKTTAQLVIDSEPGAGRDGAGRDGRGWLHAFCLFLQYRHFGSDKREERCQSSVMWDNRPARDVD